MKKPTMSLLLLAGIGVLPRNIAIAGVAGLGARDLIARVFVHETHLRSPALLLGFAIGVARLSREPT